MKAKIIFFGFLVSLSYAQFPGNEDFGSTVSPASKDTYNTMVADSEYFFKTYPVSVPHVGPYSGISLWKLQSLPGAPKVLYLDINDIMNGEVPKSQTKQDVWQTYQIAAATFSMFMVNVTTDSAVAQAAGIQNTGGAKLLDAAGTSHSPVLGFGTSNYSRIYRYPAGGFYTGRVLSHELGHLVGLLDVQDGGPFISPPTFYYELKWAPVMGNIRYADDYGIDCLIQWRKGGIIPNPVNKMDELQIINKLFQYRQDDIIDPVPLKYTGATGKIDADKNFGQICPNTDTDSFSFEITNERGHVRFKVDRLEHRGGSKLDIDASILDASGNVVVQQNPKAARYAKFDLDVCRGKYTLVIKGGAEGTPPAGFTNYSSMGFYGIEGEIIDGTTNIVAHVDANGSISLHKLSSNGIWNVDIPNKYPFEKITLFSIKGRKIFETRHKINRIDLSHESPGVYLLHVSTKGTQYIQKIMKY